MDRAPAIRKVLIITLLGNCLVSSAKVLYGYITGSIAMVSDGFHSLFDGVSNIAGLIGIWIAAHPPDRDHPYGHRKYETLFTLVIAGMIFMTSFQILKSVSTLSPHRSWMKTKYLCLNTFPQKLTIVAVLLVALLMRWILIFQGGQYYFSDQQRYLTSRVVVQYLFQGKPNEAISQLYVLPEHLGYKILGIIPALLEHFNGISLVLPALFFSLFSVLNLYLILIYSSLNLPPLKYWLSSSICTVKKLS